MKTAQKISDFYTDIIENHRIIVIRQGAAIDDSNEDWIVNELKELSIEECIIFRKRKSYEVYTVSVFGCVYYMNIQAVANIISELPDRQCSVRSSKK